MEVSLHFLEQVELDILKVLPEFWEVPPLSFVPRLEWGAETKEYFGLEKKVTISDGDVTKLGTLMASKASNPPKAGLYYLVGHSMNHFFAHNMNPDVRTYFPTKTTTDEHRAIVEGIVGVANEWLMNKLGYDGALFTRAFINTWKYNGGNQPLIDAIDKKIEDFRHLMPTSFLSFVGNYRYQSPLDF